MMADASFVLYRYPYEREYTLMRQTKGNPLVLKSFDELDGKSGFVFAPRAYSPENNVTTGKIEPLFIPDFFIQIGNKIHINIKNPATAYTSHMVMFRTTMIKMIRSFRHTKSVYLACFIQPVKISVNSSLTDGRIFSCHFFIYLVSCRMIFHSLDSF